jgi:hypothetical protein
MASVRPYGRNSPARASQCGQFHTESINGGCRNQRAGGQANFRADGGITGLDPGETVAGDKLLPLGLGSGLGGE